MCDENLLKTLHLEILYFSNILDNESDGYLKVSENRVIYTFLFSIRNTKISK